MKLPAFEAEFLQVDEDGDKVFKSMPCPFLGGDTSALFTRSDPKLVENFRILIVRKSTKSTILQSKIL